MEKVAEIERFAVIRTVVFWSMESVIPAPFQAWNEKPAFGVAEIGASVPYSKVPDPKAW